MKRLVIVAFLSLCVSGLQAALQSKTVEAPDEASMKNIGAGMFVSVVAAHLNIPVFGPQKEKKNFRLHNMVAYRKNINQSKDRRKLKSFKQSGGW